MPDPQAQQTAGMPVPPAPPTDLPDPSQAGKPTGKERALGLIGGLASIANHTNFQDTQLGRIIDSHQKQRVADATRHQTAIATYAGALGSGPVDPNTGMPVGVDPSTGQPMTPEQRAHYQALYDGAKQDYLKAVGVNKDAKATAQRHVGITDMLIQKGHKAVQTLMQAMKGGGQQQQPAGQAAPAGQTPPGAGATPPAAGQGQGMPAPPAPAAAAGPSGAAPGGSTGAATLPPPPAAPSTPPTPASSPYDDQAQADVPRLAALQAERQKQEIQTQAKVEEEKAKFHALAPKPYTRPDGSSFMGVAGPDGIQNYETHEIEHGAMLTTPGAVATAGKTIPQFGAGKEPIGVQRGGKLIEPGSPEWTDSDQLWYDAAKTAYAQDSKEKEVRQTRAMERYIQMRGAVVQYDAMDSQTGLPAKVNANTINANPGRYVPLTATQKLKDRETVFDEVENSSRNAKDAIKALPAGAFDADARAQIALALRDPDTTSAIHGFVSSEAAKTLSDAQIDYVTALVNLNESALAVRSIGGLAGQSDKLRSAIQAMIPGPGTPTKAYADRQMKLFDQEVAQFRRALPDEKGLGVKPAPGMPAPPTKPGTTVAPKTASDYLKKLQGASSASTNP